MSVASYQRSVLAESSTSYQRSVITQVPGGGEVCKRCPQHHQCQADTWINCECQTQQVCQMHAKQMVDERQRCEQCGYGFQSKSLVRQLSPERESAVSSVWQGLPESASQIGPFPEEARHLAKVAGLRDWLAQVVKVDDAHQLEAAGRWVRMEGARDMKEVYTAWEELAAMMKLGKFTLQRMKESVPQQQESPLRGAPASPHAPTYLARCSPMQPPHPQKPQQDSAKRFAPEPRSQLPTLDFPREDRASKTIVHDFSKDVATLLRHKLEKNGVESWEHEGAHWVTTTNIVKHFLRKGVSKYGIQRSNQGQAVSEIEQLLRFVLDIDRRGDSKRFREWHDSRRAETWIMAVKSAH